LPQPYSGTAERTLTTAEPAPSQGEVEFYTIPEFTRCWGIGRSLTYQLIGEGELRSITLRRRGRIKGRRLIDAASARAFFARQPSDVTPEMRSHMQNAQRKSAKAKRAQKLNGEA
jgi:hypothetical protein